MLPKQPFARRILIAFVLMTALISGLFSLSIVLVVHYIEERLMSEEMQRTLDTVIPDYQQGLPLRVDPQSQFFASNSKRYAIPPAFQGLQLGFNEILEDDGDAFYAFALHENGETFVLVQDQKDFELHEQALFSVVLVGFLLCLLLAYTLGLLMARKVMTPLSRLTGQVRHRDQLHPLAPVLAADYPDDEVGQLAAAFDSTLGEIRQLLSRERLFTSDVSHELRTPLMVIASSCELLSEAPLPAVAREPIARINRACSDMRSLVEIFLHLARGKDSTDSLSDGASLKQIAEEQYQRWQPLFAEKRLSFTLIQQGQDSGLYPKTFLATVMTNLLRNALHYSEQGTVQLVLQTGGFRVEDEGCGIAPSEQEAIFQPFVRGQSARGEGLGLGLSLAKRICTRQGWTITLDSQREKGCCFVVRLQAG